jgi:hypothetical protein
VAPHAHREVRRQRSVGAPRCDEPGDEAVEGGAPVEARLGAVVEPQVLRVLGHPPACTGEAGRAALDRIRPERSITRAPGSARAFAMSWRRTLTARSAGSDPSVGHVRARDPTRALIRASGTSFLLSLVLGDLTGSTVIRIRARVGSRARTWPSSWASTAATSSGDLARAIRPASR